jgi:chromosomal replication initiator protein
MGQDFNWDQILGVISKQVGAQEFRAWLAPTRLLSVKDGKITVSVPTQFHSDWINDHFQDLIQDTAKTLFDGAFTLSTVCEGIPTEEAETAPAPAAPTENDGQLAMGTPTDALGGELCAYPRGTAEQDEGVTVHVSTPAPTSIKTVGEAINPFHTFDHFVVGASNQFAHAACRAVAEFPASQYNPLFLYSNAGLGKTHLLHAIANAYLQAHPKAKVCYLSAERFVNELIESLRNQRMLQFRQKYRDSYDMLLMDDFQFIAGKDRTQEEFFHTFNALHQSKRQIIVTSDKPPQDIPGLEDRIRTRFECGLIADIQPPEIETRIAILRGKAEQDDIFLPEDVTLFLASNIKSNIRELEGVLIRLEAQASLNGVEISLELAKKELSDRIKDPITTVSTDTLLNNVARHFNVRVADLKSKDRSRKFSLPRQVAMYLLRKYTHKSLPEIGLCLGGKDHSTVIYGINAITASVENDPIVQKQVEEIQNML